MSLSKSPGLPVDTTGRLDSTPTVPNILVLGNPGFWFRVYCVQKKWDTGYNIGCAGTRMHSVAPRLSRVAVTGRCRWFISKLLPLLKFTRVVSGAARSRRVSPTLPQSSY